MLHMPLEKGLKALDAFSEVSFLLNQDHFAFLLNELHASDA